MIKWEFSGKVGDTGGYWCANRAGSARKGQWGRSSREVRGWSGRRAEYGRGSTKRPGRERSSDARSRGRQRGATLQQKHRCAQQGKTERGALYPPAGKNVVVDVAVHISLIITHVRQHGMTHARPRLPPPPQRRPLLRIAPLKKKQKGAQKRKKRRSTKLTQKQ